MFFESSTYAFKPLVSLLQNKGNMGINHLKNSSLILNVQQTFKLTGGTVSLRIYNNKSMVNVGKESGGWGIQKLENHS